MKGVHEVLADPGCRIAYGTYRFTRNLLWLPASLCQLARFAVRREVPCGFLERQGMYQAQRPAKNPLMWFHANSAGECVLCLPLIHRVVVEYNEKVLILVTVRSEDALELLQSSLPDRVLLIRAPHDTPFAVNRFLEHWRPCIGVMMSAWLAPNLVVMSTQAGVPLALMDGSIPANIFHFWHHIRPMRTLWRAMASCFQLIIPHSDIEVGRFRLMGASLSQMPGWCNDLSYACSLSAPVANLWRPPHSQINALEALLAGRSAWMACHVHPSDEPQLQHVHMQLRAEFSSLLTLYIYHGSDTGASLASEWAAAGVPTVCSSSMPSSRAFFSQLSLSVEGVEVLIVDTPWLTPLLMHICEIVFIGSMHFPGEQNYMVVAQAAVASCAVVASSSVMAHVQLAQELNNAAVNAAEDAAHAVRTAGFDTDAVTPWNAAQNAAQTPRSAGAQARTSPATAAPTPAAAAAADILDVSAEVGSPNSWTNRNGRPRTASRQIIFSQESLSIADSVHAASPLAADASASNLSDSIRVARRATQESTSANGADVLALEEDEVLSTGCTTPVIGQATAPRRSLADQSSSSSAAPPALASSSERAAMRPMSRSPAQPATPPQQGVVETTESHPTPPHIQPIGLPLSRSPVRVRPFPNPAGDISPTSSSCSTPFCSSTPSSLHISVLHPNMPARTTAPLSESASSIVLSPEGTSATPCKASDESSLGIVTPSPLPCMVCPPWLDAMESPRGTVLSPPVTAAAAVGESCKMGAAIYGALPLGGGPMPVSATHAMRSVDIAVSPQATFEHMPPSQMGSQAQNLVPPFAEDSLRHLHGNDGDSGAVLATANLAQPAAAVGAAKDAHAESHVARNMIGSDRPMSRPATAGSTAAVATVSGAQVPERRCSPSYSLSCETSVPVLSNCTPAAVRSQGDLAGSARQLQSDCMRDEGAMSPVVPAPAGLHRIRLQRPRNGDTWEVSRYPDAADTGPGDGESDAGAATDLWAGVSPFMSTRTQASTPACAHSGRAAEMQSTSFQQPAWQDAFDDGSSTVSSTGRVTVRRSMLRYSNNYLLSAMHLPQHPEGPAVMLLSQLDALFETINSLFREPVMRQSRGYVAVQAAARLSGSLVSTIWDVLDGSVLEPALLSFEGQGGDVY